MPFIDSVELVLILGEPHSTVHRALTGLLADGIVGRVSHGTAHLPSSQRYYLTAKGVSEAAEFLGFETPSDFMRAYPNVQGVADAAHPQDGRGGRRLPPRGVTVLRGRRAPFLRGVPPQGPLRCHGHAPRRPQLRRGAPGPGPAQALPLRPAAGHSRVRLHPPPRHHPDPGSQRVGAEVDGEVLRAHLSQGLLHRRGVEGCARTAGPSPLATDHGAVRKHVPHPQSRQLPGQPRRKAAHRVAGAQTRLHTPP